MFSGRHKGCPATLYYVEAADGGDPFAPAAADGARDRLIFLAGPEFAAPAQAAGLELRFGRIKFDRAGAAFVSERRWADRALREWLLPSSPASGPLSPPALLSERSSEDRYADPGAPLLDSAGYIVRTAAGEMVLGGLGACDL